MLRDVELRADDSTDGETRPLLNEVGVARHKVAEHHLEKGVDLKVVDENLSAGAQVSLDWRRLGVNFVVLDLDDRPKF